MYDYKKHLLTDKHNAEQMEQQKSSNVVKEGINSIFFP